MAASIGRAGTRLEKVGERGAPFSLGRRVVDEGTQACHD
jgi:hypothetical protein